MMFFGYLPGIIAGDTHHQVVQVLCSPHLQDCEVIGWVKLCERKKLTAVACFQLEWLFHRGELMGLLQVGKVIVGPKFFRHVWGVLR